MTGLRTLVVGIGSPHGDDRAGWIVADRVARAASEARVAVRIARSPIEAVDWLDGVRHLVLCDACRGLGPYGTTRRWEWPIPVDARMDWSGTHDMPLPAVLALAERLGKLPSRVVIWAVEGRPSAQHSDDAHLSPELVPILDDLAMRIVRDIEESVERP